MQAQPGFQPCMYCRRSWKIGRHSERASLRKARRKRLWCCALRPHFGDDDVGTGMFHFESEMVGRRVKSHWTTIDG
nr:hypothetical protein CFP56_24354 [Quercus suber]